MSYVIYYVQCSSYHLTLTLLVINHNLVTISVSSQLDWYQAQYPHNYLLTSGVTSYHPSCIWHVPLPLFCCWCRCQRSTRWGLSGTAHLLCLCQWCCRLPSRTRLCTCHIGWLVYCSALLLCRLKALRGGMIKCYI